MPTPVVGVISTKPIWIAWDAPDMPVVGYEVGWGPMEGVYPFRSRVTARRCQIRVPVLGDVPTHIAVRSIGPREIVGPWGREMVIYGRMGL